MAMQSGSVWRIFVDAGREADEAIRAGTSSAEKAGPRGAAGGDHTIGPIKANSAGGKSIDIWRDDLRMTIATELRPEVVNRYHEDIGPIGLGDNRESDEK